MCRMVIFSRQESRRRNFGNDLIHSYLYQKAWQKRQDRLTVDSTYISCMPRDELAYSHR